MSSCWWVVGSSRSARSAAPPISSLSRLPALMRMTWHTKSATCAKALELTLHHQTSSTKSAVALSIPYTISSGTSENTRQTGGLMGADANLPGAWQVTTGSEAIVIAVLDDGVQLDHPDLLIFTNPNEIAGNGLDDDQNGWIDDVHGWDFDSQGSGTPGGDNDPSPATEFDNHGTAVAGITGAIGNNNVGLRERPSRRSFRSRSPPLKQTMVACLLPQAVSPRRSVMRPAACKRCRPMAAAPTFWLLVGHWRIRTRRLTRHWNGRQRAAVPVLAPRSLRLRATTR